VYWPQSHARSAPSPRRALSRHNVQECFLVARDISARWDAAAATFGYAVRSQRDLERQPGPSRPIDAIETKAAETAVEVSVRVSAASAGKYARLDINARTIGLGEYVCCARAASTAACRRSASGLGRCCRPRHLDGRRRFEKDSRICDDLAGGDTQDPRQGHLTELLWPAPRG
jgi:hypothetical protein